MDITSTSSIFTSSDIYYNYNHFIYSDDVCKNDIRAS